MIRLYIASSLSKAHMLRLSPAQQHYLINVMRLHSGSEILVFNSDDGEWRAHLVLLDKRQAHLEIREQTRAQATTPDVELWTALVKRARLETIIEKATELGARRVRLVLTRRTNAERANIARLQAIAVEASEQTGRLDVPEVLPPTKLDVLLDAPTDGRRLLFCDEQGDDQSKAWGGTEGRAPPALEALARLAPGAPFAVLIGPEGGFTPEERARLRSVDWVVPASLGPRILRADTAAIAALALWQARLGDWSGLELPPG